MLSFDEAWQKLIALAAGAAVATERVALDDACGRVLREEVRSPLDLPAFDYSAMDGYAVRSEDFRGRALGGCRCAARADRARGDSPRRRRSVPHLHRRRGAGAGGRRRHAGGGRADGEQVTFRERPPAGAHIRRRGADLAKGAIALSPGTRLSPSHVALAAAADRAWLEVSRRPVVTVLGTGDELRPPGTQAAPGTIPESNTVALRAMAGQAGAAARVAPFVPDDAAATVPAIEDALVAATSS